MQFMRENLLEQEIMIAPIRATAIADRKFDNFYGFTGARETIMVTFPSAVSFDRLWLKTEGVSSWTLVSSGTTNASESNIADGVRVSFLEVTVRHQTTLTFEFTRATGATEGRVYEIMLMPLIFALDNSQRPMRFDVEEQDPSGAAYRTEDDILVSYAGQSEGKAIVNIGWDYMPKRFTDQLRQLWKGPPLRKPFIIYPEPDDNPDDIYKVYWYNNFKRVPSGQTLAAGYTVNAILWEI